MHYGAYLPETILGCVSKGISSVNEAPVAKVTGSNAVAASDAVTTVVTLTHSLGNVSFLHAGK